MKKPTKAGHAAVVIAFALLVPNLVQAQETPGQVLTLEHAIDMALENNVELKNARLSTVLAEKMKKSAFNLPAPEIEYQHGQINSSLNDRYVDISQSFDFPLIYNKQRKYFERKQSLSQAACDLTEQHLVADVKHTFYSWLTVWRKLKLAREEDSIYTHFLQVLKLRNENGELSSMTLSIAKTQAVSISFRINELELELAAEGQALQRLLNSTGRFVPPDEIPVRPPAPVIHYNATIDNSTRLRVFEQQTLLMKDALKTENMTFLPGFQLGYFNQTIDNQSGFSGWKVGLSLPLWFWSQSAGRQAAKLQYEMALNTFDAERVAVQTHFVNLQKELQTYENMLSTFESKTLGQIDEIISNSMLALDEGEINYFEYLMGISQAFQARMNYFDLLKKYNQALIEIEKYLNK